MFIARSQLATAVNHRTQPTGYGGIYIYIYIFIHLFVLSVWSASHIKRKRHLPAQKEIRMQPNGYGGRSSLAANGQRR
jgi:hypothetical protein